MVAPRLHQDLDFRIGVRPPLSAFVSLDHLHLGEGRIPGALLGESQEFLVCQLGKRDCAHGIRPARGAKRGHDLVRRAHPLHNFVVKETLGDLPRLGFLHPDKLVALGEPGEFKPVFPERPRAGHD